MKKQTISNALDNISERYIEEAAEFKIKKRTPVWVKWGALAACLALVVCMSVFMLPQLLNFDEEHTGDSAYGVEIGNFIYFPIAPGVDGLYPAVRALSVGATSECKYDIKAEHLGEYIGEFPEIAEFGEPAGKAYRFSAYPDYDSVIIVDQNGKYTFFISDGGLSSAVSDDSSSVLEAMGLPESCVDIRKANSSEPLIEDKALLKEVFDILEGKEEVDRRTITEIQWRAWCEAKGEGSVFFDENGLSFRDDMAHEEYIAFVNKAHPSFWYSTDRGFYDLYFSFNADFNYFLLCGKCYMLSDTETAQLVSLLGID